MSSGTRFKESREAERKSQAGNRVAWNTLFMRSDTVAEAVAAHYGISKSQLLSKDAADLPVRMALGEAHVIAMTKKALGDAGGVCVSVRTGGSCFYLCGLYAVHNMTVTHADTAH